MKILDDDDEHNPGSILQKILSMIRPMSLRGLNWYNSDHGITPSLVVDTFGHLPNLERIYVEETFRGPFIDALIHKSDDSTRPQLLGAMSLFLSCRSSSSVGAESKEKKFGHSKIAS